VVSVSHPRPSCPCIAIDIDATLTRRCQGMSVINLRLLEIPRKTPTKAGIENSMCDNGRVCAAKYLGKCRHFKPLKTQLHNGQWTWKQ